jgi:phosphoribosyl 1,2-cyclic phosphate phosphodiesterase
VQEEPFELAGLWIEPAFVPHGNIQTCVYKIGRFLYATDFKSFSDDLIERWRGHIDCMVASGIHFRDHPTHSNVQQTVALMGRLGVKRGVVTHLAHDIDYLRDADRLPDGIEFAYDGLLIDMDAPR